MRSTDIAQLSESAAEPDVIRLAQLLSREADTESVAGFVQGPGIERLGLSFDLGELIEAVNVAVDRIGWGGDHAQSGFGSICVNRRSGVETPTSNDLSGRYWARVDDRYVEEPFEETVDESAFTELDPRLADTYIAHVHAELTERFPIGRMRLLSKGLYNCNSWHRDPEPRLHIPIVTNPGSIFVVNHHCTHLPADGSVYFTDTRGYHTAFNGGFTPRIHLVAAVATAPTEANS
ncbi:MAG: hypothetical protein ACKVHU_10140 [Acidimicrobiales bacterium]|jgi:hypothetical protein